MPEAITSFIESESSSLTGSWSRMTNVDSCSQAPLRRPRDASFHLLQTIMQLPFGPLSVDQCETQTALMRDAPAIIVISNFMQSYIRDHGGMESHLMHLPVYGPGPFPNVARHDAGFVTMINPCPYKGVAIFQALASEFPQVPFAAVPTWGANDQVLQRFGQAAEYSSA